jgi:FeS assembly SUF system protein
LRLHLARWNVRQRMIKPLTMDSTNTIQDQQTAFKDQVIEAIKTVYDPEIPVDVFELGLIYEVNVYPVNNVFVLMTLTSPACPSAEAIPAEIKQRIKGIQGVNDVEVEVTFDPPYSPDMMSEAAKLELGFL